MAQHLSPTSPPVSYPPDLLRAVAHNALQDGENVLSFLDAFFQAAPRRPEDPPPRLTADFVLELAAALRLLIWEQQGLRLHRDAGLPSAHEALRDVLLSASKQQGATASAAASSLARRVLALSIERLAWAGREELGAEVVLDPADEDAVLERLADYLWEHRHSGTKRN